MKSGKPKSPLQKQAIRLRRMMIKSGVVKNVPSVREIRRDLIRQCKRVLRKFVRKAEWN